MSVHLQETGARGCDVVVSWLIGICGLWLDDVGASNFDVEA